MLEKPANILELANVMVIMEAIMTQDLVPAQQFMKQYNFSEFELHFVRKKNNQAVVFFEGRFFVNTKEFHSSVISDDIFLSMN